MSNYALGFNTILHTKDGSKIGNAIVTGSDGRFWVLTTDYGNKVRLTDIEISKLFKIAWLNYSKEIEGYDCKEMQEMMSSDHKHRVVICPKCGSGNTEQIVCGDNGCCNCGNMWA